MATKQWGTVHQAAAILSENAGHTIAASYVRLLAKAGHIRVRPIDGRTNEYNLSDCRRYTVRQKQGK